MKIDIENLKIKPIEENTQKETVNEMVDQTYKLITQPENYVKSGANGDFYKIGALGFKRLKQQDFYTTSDFELATNPPEIEIIMQNKVASLARELNSKVIVPKPYGLASYSEITTEPYTKRKFYIILMEAVNAFQLDEYEKGIKVLPKSFNKEEFFSILETFLVSLHEQKIFHRDIKMKNILLYEDKENNTCFPVLIDFGLSVQRFSKTKDPYNRPLEDEELPDLDLENLHELMKLF